MQSPPPDGRSREERLEEMMARYGDALIRMCCLYLRDASLAEDAAQDAFVKAWRHMDRFRGHCSERTWLMRIAINVCRDYYKTAWMRHIDRSTSLDALPEQGREDAHSPVLEAVTTLKRREKEAILLHYYQGLSLKETAKALGISESAVKQRMQRANQHLKQELEEWYHDAF